MAKRQLIINHKLFNEAQKHLVGGVDSPVRSFKQVGIGPILVKKGRGAYVWDYDGNRYIDYCLSWGTMILGHAHPLVIKELKSVVDDGLGFGTTNEQEIELAKTIRRAIGFIDRIRFVNSGTEAVMGAVRLARGYTGRDKIVKFKNAYHGHADYLLTESDGVPGDFLKHTLLAPPGDTEFIENLFKKHSSEIAAVIVEPVGGNYGVVGPDRDFLKRLRELTGKYKSLLIFDEVITAFRFYFGSAAEELRIVPDLICLGKIIGGGLPIGAYGGRKAIMEKLAPLGGVYQAGTFSGNPIVMRSGIATLKAMRALKRDYPRLNRLTAYLSSVIQKEADSRGIALKVDYYGTMFSLKFRKIKQFKKFYKGMLEHGVYLAPSQFEANFLSFAHTQKEIEKTIDAARKGL